MNDSRKTTVTETESKELCEKYFRIEHKSGLSIGVFPKKLSTFYALFGTRYGAVDNVFSKNGGNTVEVPNGIAHFLEHKMFENGDGSDTFSLFAKTGANANAFTSHAMTAYLFSCTDNFPKSLRILLDFVTKPYFTEKTVEKEKGIIGQEIGMYKDNPGTAVYYSLLRSLYHENPVRIEIAGTVESIADITDKTLYECYNTFYNLSNMYLAVCGDTTPEEVIAAADEILSDSEPVSIRRIYPDELESVKSKRSTRHMQVSIPLFAIGAKDCVTVADGFERMKRDAAMSIVNDMLFGSSSDFFNKLYEDGTLPTDPEASYETGSGFAFEYIGGMSRDPEKVYSAFRSTADAAISKGLDRELFRIHKNIAAADYIKDFDSTDEIASNMLDLEFSGGDIFGYYKALNEVDADYAESLIKEIFDEKKCSMAVIMPLKEDNKA